MTMRISAVCFHLAVLFIANGCAVQQQKFEPTGASMRQAIARGEAKEFLVALEVMGSEAEKKGRWAEASMAYTRASAAARETGQLQKAIAHGTAAVEMAQRAKDALAQSSAIRRLGGVYNSLGQFEREREWLQRGLEVAKQISGDRKEGEQAILYGQLGANFLRQGELQNAIEYISHSVQILDSTLIYYRSLRLYLKPKPILQQESDLVDALNRLGVAYLRAGNAQEAIRAFERGLTIVKTSKLDAPAEGSLSLGLGQAYVAQKDFLRAMENLSKALQTAEARRQTSTIQAASNAIGEIFLQTEKPSEAISYYKKAIDSIESTRSLLESEEFRTTFFANKGQTYDGMILAQLRTGNVEEAFNYNERARSRAFLDILGNKVQLGRQRALLEEERALLAKISEVRAKLAGQGDDGEGESDSGPTQLRQELDAAQKAYTDFLAKVRNENKEQASLMNVEPLTVKQVQEILDPGVVVLEYFVTQDGVLLWIVDKDKVASVKVALLRKKLQAKVSAFREAIQQFDENDKFRQQSEELFRVLIQPALAHIRGKELLIIPHDVLHYVPFQALLAPNGKYLIEDYPINYLSSASLMQFTQEKRKAKGELTSILAQA